MLIASHSILNNFTKAEVVEIVEVIKYFNTTCREESRAECLLRGCQNEDIQINKRLAPLRDNNMTIERFSKSAGASYSGPTRSTCSKCGAPL